MSALPAANREHWLGYLSQRNGSFHYRARRFAACAAALEALGLRDGDLVYDVGAGMCEFGKYLYASGWTGRYVPVDGAIDGTDIDHWEPPLAPDYIVSLETVEHLEEPFTFLVRLMHHAARGAVITTPNPDVVDVLALDPTHRHPISAHALATLGWRVIPMDLFGQADDTLLATFVAEGQ